MFLTRRLQVDGEFEEVQHKVRHDAHWLQCTSQMIPSYSIATILGIPEDKRSAITPGESSVEQGATTVDASNFTVDLTFYKLCEMDGEDVVQGPVSIDLSTTHPGPHAEWTRSWIGSNADVKSSESADHSSLWWIDLRPATNDSTIPDKILSKQEDAVQLFRSVLTTSHDASPWFESKKSSPDGPHIVAFALLPNSQTTTTMEELRVSDIAPSWFLHARVELDSLEYPEDIPAAITSHHCTGSPSDTTSSSPATMLIYKRIGPRTKLFNTCPPGVESSQTQDANRDRGQSIEGCLWEGYLEQEDDEATKGAHKNNLKDDSSAETKSYRVVCPPYLNLNAEYKNTCIPKLILPESIQTFLDDALSILHWTPWPESVHYKINSSNGETTKPWTVFPLCHCFPANRPENLTWIPATRSHVPNTCALLEEFVGPLHLRTALFSQLAPNSVLEAHTGWADLANHVLRLHIPLIVPQHEAGLCGTWVDGCVETHAVGRPLLFDDSKIHRAFNYSNKTRIVLIVDLARPSHLPPGYADGGHTDELDAFIQQMSMPL